MAEDYIYHILELLYKGKISLDQARKLIDMVINFGLVKKTGYHTPGGNHETA